MTTPTFIPARIAAPRHADGSIDFEATDALIESGVSFATLRRADQTDWSLEHLRRREGLTHEELAEIRAWAKSPAGTPEPRRRQGAGSTEVSAKVEVQNDDELVAWLAAQTWSDFAQSLAKQAARRPLSPKQVAAAERMRAKAEASAGPRLASEKQVALATKLIEERPSMIALLDTNLPSYTGTQISALIDGLLATPKEGKAPVELGVPNGYYAVDTEEGHLGFYRVSERGLAVQAGAEFHYLGRAAATTVAAKIQADLEAAQQRYAAKLGRCYVCNRTLTDEASRASGIGPICASK